MTLKEVGQLMDPPLSGSRVGQIEKEALDKIRRGLMSDPGIMEWLKERGLVPDDSDPYAGEGPEHNG